jgi:parafibromin
MRPEDLIPVYRKRTSIDTSGKETVTQAKYFVIDSVETLSKFGADAWDRVVCVMTTGQAWQFRPYKWNEPRQLFHNGVQFNFFIASQNLTGFSSQGNLCLVVK